MLISKLIKQLETIRRVDGDIEVESVQIRVMPGDKNPSVLVLEPLAPVAE